MDAKVELIIGYNRLVVEGAEPFVKEQVDLFYEFAGNSAPEEPPEEPQIDDKHVTPKGDTAGVTDVRQFFSAFSPETPSETALVLAGFVYTQRGSAPFERQELKSLFDEVGAPSPARLDMTLRNMQREGKRLFQPLPGGLFRPTVHGENHFKADMKLAPGKPAAE